MISFDWGSVQTVLKFDCTCQGDTTNETQYLNTFAILFKKKKKNNDSLPLQHVVLSIFLLFICLFRYLQIKLQHVFFLKKSPPHLRGKWAWANHQHKVPCKKACKSYQVAPRPPWANDESPKKPIVTNLPRKTREMITLDTIILALHNTQFLGKSPV